MAFDLSTAQPIESKGFDLSTAKPVGGPTKMDSSDYLAALPETLGRLGSSAIAAPISGLAGLGAMAGHALGLTKSDPADVVNSVQQAMTYQPRTQGGQALSDKVAYPFQKFAQGADWAGRNTASLTGSPLLGTMVNTAIQGAPLLLGTKLPGALPKAAPILDPAVASATRAGLTLTPEQAGGGLLARAVQSLSGSAKLERTNSKINAPVVNDLAKVEIGLPRTAKLNDASLAIAKAPHNQIYNQVSKLGTVPTDAAYQQAIANIADRTGGGDFNFYASPAVTDLKSGFSTLQQFDAKNGVNMIRTLRKESNANQKIYDPEKNALGVAQRSAADALEDQLDRHVQNMSQTGSVPPNLIDQFRDARVQLAKINSVENALDGTNISAKALAKQKDRGVPLSGNLDSIASAYGNFDRSLQDVSKIRDSGPFGALDALLGAGAGLAHPAALGAIVARPLARSVLASRPYQQLGIQQIPLMAPPAYPGLMGAGKLLPLSAQPQGLLTQQQ